MVSLLGIPLYGKTAFILKHGISDATLLCVWFRMSVSVPNSCNSVHSSLEWSTFCSNWPKWKQILIHIKFRSIPAWDESETLRNPMWHSPCGHWSTYQFMSEWLKKQDSNSIIELLELFENHPQVCFDTLQFAKLTSAHRLVHFHSFYQKWALGNRKLSMIRFGSYLKKFCEAFIQQDIIIR